jgi:hypothetical protein
LRSLDSAPTASSQSGIAQSGIRTIAPCNFISLKPGSRYPCYVRPQGLPEAERARAVQGGDGADAGSEEIAMAGADELRKAAGEIAKEVGRRAEAAGQRDAASVAYQRLATFQPEIGGTLQCPSCWIHYGSQAPLVAIPAINPAATPGFSCGGCDFSVSPPPRD